MYGIHTTMTLLCRILHAVEPINDEMYVTNNWNTWPFILEYFKGNGFQWMTSYQHIANRSAQLSMEICPSPSYIYYYGNWKCSHRWMKQPLFYCFENNSKQNRSKKNFNNVVCLWWFSVWLNRWFDVVYFLWFNIDTCMSLLLL